MSDIAVLRRNIYILLTKRALGQNHTLLHCVKNDIVTCYRNMDCHKVHQLPFIIFVPSFKKYEIEILNMEYKVRTEN